MAHHSKYSEPKWIGSEWCTNNSPDDADCEVYQNVTNVVGGIDDKIKWLDWDPGTDDGHLKFKWSEDPQYSFFIGPQNSAYMYLWDNKGPGNKEDVSKSSITTGDGNYPTNHADPNCSSNSNISNCTVSHDRGVEYEYQDKACWWCDKKTVSCDSWGPSTKTVGEAPGSYSQRWNATSVDDNDYHKDCKGICTNQDSNQCYGCGDNSPAECTSKYVTNNCPGTNDTPNNLTMRSWNRNSDGSFCHYLSQIGSCSFTDGSGNLDISKRDIPAAFLFNGRVTDWGDVRPSLLAGQLTVGGGAYTSDLEWTGCGVDSCLKSGKDMCRTKGTNFLDNDAGWISKNGAASCCATVPNNVGGYLQCGSSADSRGAFDPSVAGTKCPTLMDPYCIQDWIECSKNPDSCTGQVCDTYLQNSSPSAKTSVRGTITDYINSEKRDPSDYISWKLRNRVYYPDGMDSPGTDSPSKQYYDNNQCGSTVPSGGINPTSACDRDDSKNIFFTDTINYLCSRAEFPETGCSKNPGAPTGWCDDMLHYFCQQFDSEDIEADPTLAGMCGCFLMPPRQTTPYYPPTIQGHTWKTLEGTPQAESPYSTIVPSFNCDVMCMTSKLQACPGTCQSSMCVIDNVTINYVNSNIDGGTSINQACGSCGGASDDDSGGQCICYMDGITINSFNSGVDGGVELSQTCGQCYQQNEEDGPWVEVNCETGDPVTPDDSNGNGNGNGNDNGNPWWKKKLTVIMVVIIFLSIVLFLGFWYYRSHASKVNADMVSENVPYDDYYYY